MVPMLQAADPTYNQDVAPILSRHCVVCHRPNDIAPMSLESYREARPWAAAIREAVATKSMPPWHGDPGFHKFSNDPRLTDGEVATLLSWVRTGAKEGATPVKSETAPWPAGWHILPDAILTLTEEQVVAAGAQDEYEYVHVPTHFTEDKWVQVAEVLPGNRRIVHHATVSVWDPPAPHADEPNQPKVSDRESESYSPGGSRGG